MNENKKDFALLIGSAFVAGVIAGSAMIYSVGKKTYFAPTAIINDAVNGGIELPFDWNGLGAKLVASGAVDAEKFKALYAGRGLDDELENLLKTGAGGRVIINSKNSGLLLNLLWAYGLSSKNKILEEGPMSDSRYGGAGGFASTGGWTLAVGNAMDHYSAHNYVILTEEQQSLVERVAKNIYRPCCGNSVYFPDCNHGMAMLGLLELMASQGVDEKAMYQAALAANSLWFPDQYSVIARYFASQGTNWNDVDPKTVLGAAYSSASGYRRVAAEVGNAGSGGGSCGVDAAPSRPSRSSGCGVE